MLGCAVRHDQLGISSNRRSDSWIGRRHNPGTGEETLEEQVGNMNPVVFPVLETHLNLPGLLRACREMKLPNPAAESDQRGEEGIIQAVNVLDSIQELPYLTTAALQIGYLVVALDCDMPAIVANARGVVHLYHSEAEEASQGEALCCIMTGSIDQWLWACVKASIAEADPVVRYTFNRVYRDITSRLPSHVWKGGSTRDHGDGTFLLDYQP